MGPERNRLVEVLVKFISFYYLILKQFMSLVLKRLGFLFIVEITVLLKTESFSSMANRSCSNSWIQILFCSDLKCAGCVVCKKPPI